MSVLDPYDVRRVREAPGLLRAFNDAAVLTAADVHVARRLLDLSGQPDELVALAVGLAVRAPRLGSVCVDLARARDTVAVDADEPVDVSTLPWPDLEPWLAAVAKHPLAGGPLHLDGTLLYLDRYHREEERLAADLRAFGSAEPNEAKLADGLVRLRLGGRQREAAETAVRRGLTVVAGGPGTGKTTTVARIVALLCEQSERPLIALAAPTGKAAARLTEAVHLAAEEMDVAPAVRDRLGELEASTLHRLLGWRPDSHSRFRHNRGNRLPHDVVIVDETSMVSLSLMARLVEAVRPSARLVLVGDPAQLTSIEAGAVLGDVVGPGTGEGVVTLDRVHRYGGAIAELAEAVHAGDADAALAVLNGGGEDVVWVDDAEAPLVRELAVVHGRRVAAAARAGDAAGALDALQGFRILCAHRRGPYGAATFNARVEAWLGAGGEGPWYPGRPLLVTENDYELRLFNGDAGVVVQTAPDRVSAVFDRAPFAPTRLGAVETVYAMTIHKSQGSQFEAAAVLLPEATSPILTRELLYTGVTRAQKRLVVAGTEEAIRLAVERPVARASGLRQRLWGSA
ncbi:MAG: exodeoxyribonuclease alpha subunit [Solirubrobacteraceae bacterium]|nr:exodeoxyribonuclease alpha subunit [Solirubrobacteraceae bacterium]